jgi:hypothetical protein
LVNSPRLEITESVTHSGVYWIGTSAPHLNFRESKSYRNNAFSTRDWWKSLRTRGLACDFTIGVS